MKNSVAIGSLVFVLIGVAALLIGLLVNSQATAFLVLLIFVMGAVASSYQHSRRRHNLFYFTSGIFQNYRVSSRNSRTIALRSIQVSIILAGILGSTDVFRHVEVLDGVSLMGIFTLAIFVLGFVPLVLLGFTGITKAVTLIWPFLFVSLWSLISSFWGGSTIPGLQNTIILLVFCEFALLSFMLFRVDTRGLSLTGLSNTFSFTAWISLATYHILTIFVPSGAANPRSYALSAVVTAAYLLGHATRPNRSAPLVTALMLIVSVVSTLSRTASAIAGILLLIAVIRPGSWKGVIRFAIVLPIAIFLVQGLMNLDSVKARFTNGDVESVGGVQIAVQGRGKMWRVTIASALAAPIWGQGAGSAQKLMVETFHKPGMDHPHNDYLKLFHDYGEIGLGMWFMGMVLITVAIWRRWLFSSRYRPSLQPIHFSALLSVIVLLFSMITDNTLAYIMVMLPIGVILGASLGLGSTTGMSGSAALTNKPLCGFVAEEVSSEVKPTVSETKAI